MATIGAKEQRKRHQEQTLNRLESADIAFRSVPSSLKTMRDAVWGQISEDIFAFGDSLS